MVYLGLRRKSGRMFQDAKSLELHIGGFLRFLVNSSKLVYCAPEKEKNDRFGLNKIDSPIWLTLSNGTIINIILTIWVNFPNKISEFTSKICLRNRAGEMRKWSKSLPKSMVYLDYGVHLIHTIFPKSSIFSALNQSLKWNRP